MTDTTTIARFATWLRRSPQLHLAEAAVGTVTRNATMTGHRFLFRANLRQHDLAAEIYHVKEQQKVPMILNQGWDQAPADNGWHTQRPPAAQPGLCASCLRCALFVAQTDQTFPDGQVVVARSCVAIWKRSRNSCSI